MDVVFRNIRGGNICPGAIALTERGNTLAVLLYFRSFVAQESRSLRQKVIDFAFKQSV